MCRLYWWKNWKLYGWHASQKHNHQHIEKIHICTNATYNSMSSVSVVSCFYFKEQCSLGAHLVSSMFMFKSRPVKCHMLRWAWDKEQLRYVKLHDLTGMVDIQIGYTPGLWVFHLWENLGLGVVEVRHCRVELDRPFVVVEPCHWRAVVVEPCHRPFGSCV